jgi:hypothetical protein
VRAPPDWGAKSKDKRPEFDALHKLAARREFDVVMAWSVDCLGRSLRDLVAFLSEIHVSLAHPIAFDARERHGNSTERSTAGAHQRKVCIHVPTRADSGTSTLSLPQHTSATCK